MTQTEPTSYAYDLELAAVVPLLPNFDLTDPAAARQAAEALFAAAGTEVDRTGVAIDDHAVARPDGPDVRVRLYRPADPAPPGTGRAALLHLHGGGFILGSPEWEEAGSVALVRRLGIVVASVDYRLAPEHPYPAGLDDCAAALEWLHGRAGDLGVDPDRIGLYGQSAGGGLAAGLALRVRDRGGPPICFQFLGIPELDDRLDTPSMRAFVDTPLWSRPKAELSWRHYLRELDGEVPCYAAPARATDLSGLPPAYVSAMEFDPLRDEAVDYASRLLAAGVPTELHVFPGTFHGSALVTTAAVSKRATEEAYVALARGLRLDQPGSA